ncbi:MAG TPA: hypothetical protein VGR19_06175 [Allosphingosinicella sp.]|nr:hypothetical protein [Allosphingosinicella sp.]
MRNVSKLLSCSIIASAALLVSACGGGETEEANNTMMTDMNAADTMMDGTTNDVTAIDAGTGADANMTMDANMSGGNMSDANMSGNMSGNMSTTDANMTNGM